MMTMNAPHARTSSLRFLSNPNTIRWGKRLLFTLGILLFTLVQLVMVVLPIRNRTVPVETDDAYTYILKAAQMQDCFLQNCPALNDLRQQLTAPTEKPNMTWIRYREYVRAFSIYHPLHSLILVGLHAAGLSWEGSYHVIEIVGSLFLSLAVSYWLYHLFGSGPAGIALLLLAFTPFPNQGLHYVVPSNLALGVGMLMWGSLFKRDNRSGWILVASTVILVLMHPIGRLYALLGIVLFVFLNVRQMKRADWRTIGLSVFIIAMAFLLPLVVTRPELSFPADPPPPDWTRWSGYTNNFKQSALFVALWMRSYGGSLIAVLLILVGLMSLPPLRQRTQVIVMGVLLGGLLGASLLQVLPRYPAEAFSRVWIPFTIFLTGLIAHGIWRWAAAVVYWIRQILDKGVRDFRDERLVLSISGWAGVLLLLFGIVVARNTVNHVIDGQRILRETLPFTIGSQNSRFDTNQPSALLGTGCEDVLYMFEVPMHVYFAHGALECGAIYQPGVTGTPEEAHWIGDNQNLGYVVTWNPTIRASVTTGGNPLTVEAGKSLEFYVPADWPSGQLYLYLENTGGETRLNLSPLPTAVGEKRKVTDRIQIPANWSGWQAIDIRTDELAQGFVLQAARGSGEIFLRGIRSEADSPWNWPWDQGLALVQRPSNPDVQATEMSFDTTRLIPYSAWSLTVLEDQGDTVLLRINR
ncbi:MAG TPA: hypothetical protein VFG81_03580 [Anaerolineales bacterium]|jgi:hypothetical protein|nr:hypothetical protein [Anaerolineales bacterium]